MFSLALVALAALSKAQPEVDDHSTLTPGSLIHGVVDLDDWSFDTIVDGHHPALIAFYNLDNCPDGNLFATEFALLADKFSGNNDFILGKVEATENQELAARFSVTACPTFVFFPTRDISLYIIYGESTWDEDSLELWLNEEANVYREGQLDYMNDLAVQFINEADENRPKTLAEAESMAKMDGLSNSARQKAQYYVSVMQKVLEKGDSYIEEEISRIERLVEAGDSKDKIKVLKRKLNVLDVFDLEMTAEEDQ